MNNLRYVQDMKEIAIDATTRLKQAVTNERKVKNPVSMTRNAAIKEEKH